MLLFMSGLVHSAKHLLGSSMYVEIFSSPAGYQQAYSPVDGLKMLLLPAVTEDAGCKCSQEILLWMCMSGSLGQIPRRGRGA